MVGARVNELKTSVAHKKHGRRHDCEESSGEAPYRLGDVHRDCL